MNKTQIRKSEMTQPATKHTLASNTESVADIFEREQEALIYEWLGLVEEQADLMIIPLSYEARTGHLPMLLRDVTARLRLQEVTKRPLFLAANHHGDLRLAKGYTVALVVEESRLLQVSLFTTLHKNTNRSEFSRLHPDLVTIADEPDAQLKQQILRFMDEDAIDNKSVLN